MRSSESSCAFWKILRTLRTLTISPQGSSRRRNRSASPEISCAPIFSMCSLMWKTPSHARWNNLPAMSARVFAAPSCAIWKSSPTSFTSHRAPCCHATSLTTTNRRSAARAKRPLSSTNAWHLRHRQRKSQTPSSIFTGATAAARFRAARRSPGTTKSTNFKASNTSKRSLSLTSSVTTARRSS